MQDLCQGVLMGKLTDEAIELMLQGKGGGSFATGDIQVEAQLIVACLEWILATGVDNIRPLSPADRVLKRLEVMYLPGFKREVM